MHRKPSESAGIVDTVLCVESKGRGFESIQRISFFHTFLRQGLNIAQNINNVMFYYYYFNFFFFTVHQSVAAFLMRLMHQ